MFTTKMTKISLRFFFSLSFLVGVFCCATAAAALTEISLPPTTMSEANAPRQFRCIHDDEETQNTIERHLRETRPLHRVAGKQAAISPAAAAHESIRIVVSAEDLHNSNYCTTVGETKPDFRGGTATCRTEDILTATKRSVLLDKILPEAIAQVQQVLTVARASSNLIIPADACSGLGYSIPASHTTTGVPNADLVLLVSAARAPSGVLAFAGPCVTDSSGRPLVSRINFSPEFLLWESEIRTFNTVATAVHEIFHALDFRYSAFVDAGLVKTATRRGTNVTVFTGAKTRDAARAFFACTALDGVELEGEGGAGTRLSHLDMRLLPQELMAPAAGTHLSEISASMLADLGHYSLNASTAAPYRNMTFGFGAGCSFVAEKCSSNNGVFPPSAAGAKFFHFEAASDVCSYDFVSAGSVGILKYGSALPEQFQYFPSDPKLGGRQFYDYCPILEPSRICNENRASSVPESVFGHTFSTFSRCFKTENLLRNGYSASLLGATRCLVSRCATGEDGNQVVQFSVNGSAWLTCEKEGAKFTDIPRHQGSVFCPDSFSQFCSWYERVPEAPGTAWLNISKIELGFKSDLSLLERAQDLDTESKIWIATGCICFVLIIVALIALWHYHRKKRQAEEAAAEEEEEEENRKEAGNLGSAEHHEDAESIDHGGDEDDGTPPPGPRRATSNPLVTPKRYTGHHVSP